MLDREYSIPECKIIYSGGKWTEEATKEHRLIPLVRPMEPEPVKREVVSRFRRAEPLRRERPAVIPREVPEKRNLITPEAVLSLREKGVTNVKWVAKALNCTPSIIYKRMQEAGISAERKQLKPLEPGTVFGWLEVIGEMRRDTKQGRIFACWCKCGAIAEAPYKALNNRARTSCGCKKPTRLAHNPQRVKLACKLWRKHGLSETARRLGCGNTGVYRLLVAGGVDWKAPKDTLK